MDAINTSGVEEEPDVSKGRVLNLGGGGADEGGESNPTAATQEALHCLHLFASQVINQLS